jgi:hypothetical protein
MLIWLGIVCEEVWLETGLLLSTAGERRCCWLGKTVREQSSFRLTHPRQGDISSHFTFLLLQFLQPALVLVWGFRVRDVLPLVFISANRTMPIEADIFRKTQNRFTTVRTFQIRSLGPFISRSTSCSLLVVSYARLGIRDVRETSAMQPVWCYHAVLVTSHNWNCDVVIGSMLLIQ